MAYSFTRRQAERGQAVGYRSGFLQILVLTIVTVVGCCLSPAWAEKRVALVIGNSTYRNVPSLTNPKNDAKLMADTLRDLGFSLVGDGAQLDLEKTAFDNAVRSFGSQLQGADVGLFYYAGHGIQVRGANYLVPIGANPTREADVDFELEDVALVLKQMEASGTRLNLVLLDACRNNPFGGRGLRAVDSGLAQMRAPQGTLISFATQPGNVAQDGVDENSPYTKALARTIRKMGLGIFDTFNEVGVAVKQVTSGAQQPWLSSSPIDGSFYFSRLPLVAPVPPPSPSASIDPCAAAVEHWRGAELIGTKSSFEDHLSRFSNCAFAGLAREKIETLKRLAALPPPQSANIQPPAASAKRATANAPVQTRTQSAARSLTVGDATAESMSIRGAGSIPTGASVEVTARNGRKMNCIGGSIAQNLPRRCTWQ